MKHNIPNSVAIVHTQGDPVECYYRWRSELDADSALLLVEFDLATWWLPEPGILALTAIYSVSDSGLQVSVTDQVLEADGATPVGQYARWIAEHSLVSATPGEPLGLLPSHIPKPWGQEIWFTGVEERGVCQFGDISASTPIPWLQAVMPDEAAGAREKPLLLLKVLDPAPEEVTGDLYFELHEEKREVYVVTHVDPQAWPGGTGYIRYGFDPEKVSSAGEEQFRRDYLEAVRRYEEVRREIDALPATRTPASSLLDRERELRREMNDFTHMRPLKLGDVVVVPLLMPHSLQHGVRTIEFQTPVYERQILSFAQKVLTQDHWDTEAATARMQLAPPPPGTFEQIESPVGVSIERIVDFPDFEVRRIRMQTDTELPLAPLPDYGVIMVVEGELTLSGQIYGPEQALFLPRQWGGALAPSQPARPLVLLLAMPRR